MMKKLLFMMAAVMSFMMASAQATALEQPKITDNTYVSIQGGAFNATSPWEWDNIEGMASLRAGKWLTPLFGTELEGEVGFANYTTFVDHTNVTWNAMMNMNNLFHGYKGESDRVEIAPFAGIGWHHTYGFVTNSLSWKGGISIDWNLGKDKAWQINFRPTITYLLATNGDDRLGFDINKSYTSLSVGVTYKFKNSKGTYNFVKCNKAYTQAEWDELNAELNETRNLVALLNATMSSLEETINACMEENALLKSQPNTIVVENNSLAITPVVGFTIGSAEVAETQVANIEALAKTLVGTSKKATIFGYADNGTGTPQFNQTLSEERAKAVADILIANGINEEAITTVGRGSSVQPFAANNLNRAAFIVVE